MGNLITEDWGLVDYSLAWDRQERLFHQRLEQKAAGDKTAVDRIVFCEHPHVYTLGRSGKANNLLVTEQQLQKIGASFYHIDRGGDITYHGPGQLVVYPILDLERYGLGLKDYIYLIEEAVIILCASYGIKAMRMEKATGVWLDVNTLRARKICAIGVRSSRYVTMHGLALNVNTDLRFFYYINPCGFIDKGVTSLAKELKVEVSIEEVKQRLADRLMELLNERL
jgi:lipoyl(octanoyl) transferase